jgi:hypothetical protein
MTGALENLIDLERRRGAFEADLDTRTLAYATARICEGFLHADVIADRSADIGRGITVIEALLLGLDLVQRPEAAGDDQPPIIRESHSPHTHKNASGH